MDYLRHKQKENKKQKIKAMKKSILILAAIIISLIGVNAQHSFCDQQEDMLKVDEFQLELYQSIIKDFENFYKNSTKEEMIEDEENTDLYNEIYENMELHKIVEADIKKDEENDKLYKSLKEDLEISNMLSVAELKF